MDRPTAPLPIPLWPLLAVMLVAAAFSLWGIRKDLPYTPEVDEPTFAFPAARMAASGDLNPGWFGHPGSTMIYPLAGAYHLWHATAYGGHLLSADPRTFAAFESHGAPFYLLGRLLSVAYALMAVRLVYKIGCRAFNQRVAVLATAWCALYPLNLAHVQMLRSDAAGLFFATLTLWLCLQVYDRPSRRHLALAGLALGLGVSTRYFLAVLAPVLVVATLLGHRRERSDLGSATLAAASGLLVAGATFLLSTPYFLLDFATAGKHIMAEARTTHLGADGLTPLGNLVWYLTVAFPSTMGWPQVALAAVGVTLVLVRRRAPQLLLLGGAAVFLAGVSAQALHWPRWIIQILPVMSLVAADALLSGLAVAKSLGLAPIARQGLLVIGVVVASWLPILESTQQNFRHAGYSTRVEAREWMIANLNPGARVAQEWYTAVLAGTGFDVDERPALASHRTLEDYRREGYDYLLVSSSMYGRFQAEPARYPAEVGFYRRLHEELPLVSEFVPAPLKAGPVVRVYRLSDD